MSTTRRETLRHLVGLAGLATAAACGDKEGSGHNGSVTDSGLGGTGEEGDGEEGGEEEGGDEEGGEEGGGDDTGSDLDCELYLEQAEGPYFLDLAELRTDITEGKPGKAFKLALHIIDGDTCEPVKDAVVDIWHCDAGGVYSGFSGQPGGVDTTGEIFLRGSQVSDADGLVQFVTIYPGVYQGRTVHIHLKVRVGDRARTGQMYFSQDLNDEILASAPYSDNTSAITTNADEGRSEADEPIIFVAVSEVADGLEGTLRVGVLVD